MTPEKYQELAMRTAKFMATTEFDLIHAALGLAGEAGEFVDSVKKHVIYGKELDVNNLKEEMGDCMWFIALTCTVIGFDLEQIMQENIAKLAKRYPEGYSDYAAIFRADKK